VATPVFDVRARYSTPWRTSTACLPFAEIQESRAALLRLDSRRDVAQAELADIDDVEVQAGASIKSICRLT